MKNSIIPVFIAIVSVYVIYRTYTVHQNYILIKEGKEISAEIKFRNQENHSLMYSYRINNKDYDATEQVDIHTYNENLPGDKIKIFVKSNDHKKSVIENNKKAFSYMSFSRNAASDPLIIPLWIGYLSGIILLLFGVYQFLRKYKRTPKTFE